MAPKKNQITRNRQFRKIFLYLFLYLLVVFASIGFIDNNEFNFSFLFVVFSIFILSLFTFLVFFSQFSLPVITFENRIKAFQRLFTYLFGEHGPAIFIENGELRERKMDRLRKGPGVVILDTASAAVLRTSVRYKGAIGPGIAFTDQDDSIAGVVDLHIQTNYLGPRSEEDPFESLQKNESKAAFEARTTRRDESMAITRDGIQVCFNLSIKFKLDSNPGEGNSAYGYNPSSVEKAVIGQSISFDKPEDNPERVYSWKKIPNNLVMDILREYISKYTINELFPLRKNDTNLIRNISNQIKTRLTQSHYNDFDDYGNILNETIFSKEYEILKRRGIKFLDLTITNIRFPSTIEEGLIKRWKTSWLDVANHERKIVDQQHAIQTLAGQNQALMDYAYGATKHLGSISNDKDLACEDILLALLNGNLETISQDPDLSSDLADEHKDIQDLIEWVRTQKGVS